MSASNFYASDDDYATGLSMRASTVTSRSASSRKQYARASASSCPGM